jgi:hypothetical protein
VAIQAGTNVNFLRKKPVREDYNKVARVVDFFGRLVIDWQDE